MPTTTTTTTTEKYGLGSVTTLITTIGTIANNGLAIGAIFDNTVGQTGDGATLCDLEFSGTFGVAPIANTGISFWFLMTMDGTNYEDGDGADGGSGNTTPGRAPDVVFGHLRGATIAQRINRQGWLPWGKWKPLLKNDATGQTLSAGAIIKIRPVNYMGTGISETP